MSPCANWPISRNIACAGGLAAGVEVLVELAAVRVGHDVRGAGDDVGDRAHRVGVVGDHVEVEGHAHLHRLAGVGDDLLAAGEAVGVARHQRGAGAAGVGGETGVDVGVAEVDVGREGVVGVGRIGPALEHVDRAGEPAGVLRQAGRRGECAASEAEASEGSRMMAPQLVRLGVYQIGEV